MFSKKKAFAILILLIVTTPIVIAGEVVAQTEPNISTDKLQEKFNAAKIALDSVSYYTYNVMILDDIDPVLVRNALCYIPNIFSFRIVPPDSSKYIVENYNGYEIITPIEPRLIVIYDGYKHNYKRGRITGLYHGDGKITIVFLNQSAYKLSWLITHECLHESLEKSKSGINQDIFSSYIDKWNDWMRLEGLGYYNRTGPGQVSGGWITLKQIYLISESLKK